MLHLLTDWNQFYLSSCDWWSFYLQMPKESLQEADPSAQSSSSMNFLEIDSIQIHQWKVGIGQGRYTCVFTGFLFFLTQWFKRQNFILDSAWIELWLLEPLHHCMWFITSKFCGYEDFFPIVNCEWKASKCRVQPLMICIFLCSNTSPNGVNTWQIAQKTLKDTFESNLLCQFVIEPTPPTRRNAAIT